MTSVPAYVLRAQVGRRMQTVLLSFQRSLCISACVSGSTLVREKCDVVGDAAAAAAVVGSGISFCNASSTKFEYEANVNIFCL